MSAVLDDSGLTYFWSKLKALFSGKANTGDAIKNITRSGTTFTATRADDTTFTFDQQDTHVAVVDNRSSSSTTAALSANQGRLLNEIKQATLQHVDVTKTSLRIASAGGYTTFGTLSDFGLTSTNYIVSFFIRGWSGSPGALSLVAATNGQTIYVMCSGAGTITSLTVRLWYY